MYSFNSHIVTKSTDNIIDNMDDKFEEVDEKFAEIDNKLQSIEDLINVRLEICYKKVNDIYSLQHKVNEITKMNNQSIIHQINQYDEEIEDIDVNKHNNVFNSLETSMSPQSKTNKLNNKCFIKHTNAKNQDREMFYMSSANKNELNSKNKNLSHNSTEPEAIKSNIHYKNNINESSTSNTSPITTSNTSNTSNTLTISKNSKHSAKSEKTAKSTKSNTSKKSKIYVDTQHKNRQYENLENVHNINNFNDSDDLKNTQNNNIFMNLYKNKKNGLRIVKDNISLENESNLEEFINSLPDNVVDNFFQKNKEVNTNSSVILEMNSDVVKPCEVETTSPKFANAMKILNETNIIKNSSFNKLNELNKKNKNKHKHTHNLKEYQHNSTPNSNNDFDNNHNETNNQSNKSTESNESNESNESSESSESYESDESNSQNNILENESFVFAEFPKKTVKINKIVELN